MNPMQFVREECANHRDGRCVGAMINADLSVTRCAPRERCGIADGERCRYFEECVAPMADMASDSRRATALQEAVAEYRRVTKQGKDLSRQCPECGGPMRKGKRYCPKCADARRKATLRASQARRRRSGDHMSTVVPKNTPSLAGIKRVFSAISENAIGDGHHPANGPTTVDTRLLAGRAP